MRNAALFGRPFPDLQRAAPERRSGGRHPRRAAEPRTDGVDDSRGGRRAAGRRDRSRPRSRTARRSSAKGPSPAIAADRTDLDYLRVYASKRSVVGMPLGSLTIPGGFEYSYVQVRRGDTDLLPDDDLVLEFGDRVGVLCSRANFPAVRSFFGDSIKGTADFSYISVGVGAAMGLLAGMIPIPIPGVGRITLGLAGVLLVALGAGHVPPHVRHRLDASACRRTWCCATSASPCFSPRSGMSSGPKFAATIAESGLAFVLLGALIVLPLVAGHHDRRTAAGFPTDDLFGVVSGVSGNPAILAYASRAAPTDRPDIGFAMIFPSMTIAEDSFRADRRGDFRGVNFLPQSFRSCSRVII